MVFLDWLTVWLLRLVSLLFFVVFSGELVVLVALVVFLLGRVVWLFCFVVYFVVVVCLVVLVVLAGWLVGLVVLFGWLIALVV